MLTTRALGAQGLAVSALGLGLMGMSQAYSTTDERNERDEWCQVRREYWRFDTRRAARDLRSQAARALGPARKQRFGPNVDGSFFPDIPANIFAEGKQARVLLLAGLEL